MIKDRKTICIICPVGCEITTVCDDAKIISLKGSQCKRGEVYAKNELLHPSRILTSTVKTSSPLTPVIAVRSNKMLPKELLFECMKRIKNTKADLPIKTHDCIISNILDTGVDIVASGNYSD
jgi:CxxC motif-containing protein